MHTLKSIARGEAVALTDVNDSVFSQEILGKGVAVKPAEGNIYAPADGEITMVFDSLHALTMKTEFGAELLIHVGIDTVELKGKGFKMLVKEHDLVKQGQLIMKVQLKKLEKAGYDTITPLVICNCDDFDRVDAIISETVSPDDDVIILE